MSLSLDTLARHATEAEAMPVTALLRGQCIEFAAYARYTRWHREVRDEANQLAERFEAVAYSGLPDSADASDAYLAQPPSK